MIMVIASSASSHNERTDKAMGRGRSASQIRRQIACYAGAEWLVDGWWQQCSGIAGLKGLKEKEKEVEEDEATHNL